MAGLVAEQAPADGAIKGPAVVVVRLGASGDAGVGPVLAAAAQLFGPRDPVRLVCAAAHEPTLEEAEALARGLAEVSGGLEKLPETDIVGPDGLDDIAPVLDLPAFGSDIETAVAVLALGAFAGVIAPPQPPAKTRQSGGIAELRAKQDARRRTRPTDPMRLYVIVQHLNSWGAQATIVEAARAYPGVEVEVIALDSVQSRFPGETAASLRENGIEPRDQQWGEEHIDDADVVLIVDPYDEFRPPKLRALTILAHGTRLVYSPYARAIVGDPTGLARQYNTQVHNAAWRVYVPGPEQRDMYRAHCASGAGHVRSVGSVKGEWLLTDEAPTGWAASWKFAHSIVWNSHFSLGTGGWSTFLRYIGAMTDLAAENSTVGFVIRPHFRLLPGIEGSGPDGARLVRDFRKDLKRLRNVHLDEDRDYRPALRVADAMLSDMSSMIPEFLELGRPVGYLKHPTYETVGAADDWLPDVTVISDDAGIAAFIRQLRAGTLPQPRPRPSALGSGRRVVAAMLGDWTQEVFDA